MTNVQLDTGLHLTAVNMLNTLRIWILGCVTLHGNWIVAKMFTAVGLRLPCEAELGNERNWEVLTTE